MSKETEKTKELKVEQANEEDLEWVEELFQKNEYILGPAGLALYRWKNDRKENDRLIVVREVAFARYTIRKDGIRTLHEIAVAEEAKGQGIGKRLIQEIGRPIQLKTDADNEESNNFYKALGFTFNGKKKSRNGKKIFNLYFRI